MGNDGAITSQPYQLDFQQLNQGQWQTKMTDCLTDPVECEKNKDYYFQ